MAATQTVGGAVDGRAGDMLRDFSTLTGGQRLLHCVDENLDGEAWREVLDVTIDTDGNLGGDPGDVVVSMVGDSRAYHPDDDITWVTIARAQTPGPR